MMNMENQQNGETGNEALVASPKPEENTGYLLWQVTHLWQRRLRGALDPYQLTHVQFMLLRGISWLSNQGEIVTQSRLAEHCKADQMMTSQVVRALELAGLVERRAHPTDARAKALSLTDSGTSLVSKTIPVVHESDRRFFAELGEQVPELTHMLQRLWAA